MSEDERLIKALSDAERLREQYRDALAQSRQWRGELHGKLQQQSADAERLRRERDELTDEFAQALAKVKEHKRALEIAGREYKRLREALERSAERLHGLSEDPVHAGSVFAECQAFECVEARAALDPEREELFVEKQLREAREYRALHPEESE